MNQKNKVFIHQEENQVKIEIVLSEEELNSLLIRLIDLQSEGGSFSWGYDKGQSPSQVVYFTKVKQLKDGSLIEDQTGYPTSKLLLESLEILPLIMLPLLGLYCIGSFIVSFFQYISSFP